MQVPKQLTNQLLHLNGFELKDFCNAHSVPLNYRSIRLNPNKPVPLPFEHKHPIPWTKQGYYTDSTVKFTTDPNFHTGAYYAQEPSSMFIEYVILQLQLHLKPIKALDLCAAPGGKTTILLDVLSRESLVWANEPHSTRAMTLTDTLNRWGHDNICVSNANPSTLKKALPFQFDLTLVDAPCSGSGLFRKQPGFINEWHNGMVKESRKNQELILHEAFQLTKIQGFIIYSTCSFSPEENEDLTQWFLKHYPVKHIQINVPDAWNIKISEGAYRFWPHLLKAEGFYCSIFQVMEQSEIKPVKHKKMHCINTKPKLNLPFEIKINDVNQSYIEFNKSLWVISNNLIDILNIIDNQLLILKIGTCCLTLNNKDIPEHQLAQSFKIKTDLPDFECALELALSYLKRNSFKNTISKTGWHAMTYNKLGMGWANFLNNRVNNAYPKILKILH